jgi:hypothetical protein
MKEKAIIVLMTFVCFQSFGQSIISSPNDSTKFKLSKSDSLLITNSYNDILKFFKGSTNLSQIDNKKILPWQDSLLINDTIGLSKNIKKNSSYSIDTANNSIIYSLWTNKNIELISRNFDVNLHEKYLIDNTVSKKQILKNQQGNGLFHYQKTFYLNKPFSNKIHHKITFEFLYHSGFTKLSINNTSIDKSYNFNCDSVKIISFNKNFVELSSAQNFCFLPIGTYNVNNNNQILLPKQKFSGLNFKSDSFIIKQFPKKLIDLFLNNKPSIEEYFNLVLTNKNSPNLTPDKTHLIIKCTVPIENLIIYKNRTVIKHQIKFKKKLSTTTKLQCIEVGLQFIVASVDSSLGSGLGV